MAESSLIAASTQQKFREYGPDGPPFQELIRSFGDAMIIAAAVQGAARVLLTEDLNNGQIIKGVEIRNPLLG